MNGNHDTTAAYMLRFLTNAKILPADLKTSIKRIISISKLLFRVPEAVL